MNLRIYLDNNATTSIDPRVLKVMAEVLENCFGNASSTHSFGRDARGHLTKARQLIADSLKVKAQEIIFTSNGTETLNMLIQGFLLEHKNSHVITSTVEHACVYSTIKSMEAKGHCQATFLSPGLWGAVTVDAVRQALRPDTRLIVLMAVNNETGVKTDINAIAEWAKEKGISFIVDAVCLLGKEIFIIPAGVSAMAFSGHKVHAPKGIGFAFIRNNMRLQPLLIGGEQEYNRRGGTENISGIVALAEAIRLLTIELPEAAQRMECLRNHLEASLQTSLSGVNINGEGPRTVNTSNLSFTGIDGEILLAALDLEGLAVSHGSACASGALEPSRILLNMGVPMAVAQTSIRFSLSRFTTKEEIDRCIEIVVRVVQRLRKVV